MVIPGLVLCSSCQDNCTTSTTYRSVAPVYMDVENIRVEAIRVHPSRALEQPGKIYVYGDYLFINEYQKGVHVVDNSDPSAPRFLNFIDVPGNVDMAVNDHILYADNYVDLLAFDIRDPREIRMVERVEDVFPSLYVDAMNRIFVTYKDTLLTEVTESTCRGNGMFFGGDKQGFELSSSSASDYSGAGSGYGQGGSMARFTLMNDYLYTVTDHDLRLFDVSNPSSPDHVSNIDLAWGVETIFPYQDRLFIGTTTGMHIFDASKPDDPVHLAVYEHVTSCDPVVVDGQYAYVTLRSGNFCRGFNNRLDVVDLDNIRAPRLVETYPMENPHGLGISSNYLFLCEGEFGLKSFNISDVEKISQNQLEHLKNVRAIDVIPAAASLIVTGPDGIYQFDYSDPAELRLLSKISLAGGNK